MFSGPQRPGTKLNARCRDPLESRDFVSLARSAETAGGCRICGTEPGPAVALKVYEQLAKFPEHAAFAYRRTELLSGKADDLGVRRAAAEKVMSFAKGDPNAAAQLAYVNLLAGNEVESNTAEARKLVQEHPDRLLFRIAAALGYLRQNDPAAALEQFKGPAGAPPIDWSKTPPAWRAVYAATLLANEKADAAQEIIKTIPLPQLSKEERALIVAK